MRENINNGAEMIEMEWKYGKRCGSEGHGTEMIETT